MLPAFTVRVLQSRATMLLVYHTQGTQAAGGVAPQGSASPAGFAVENAHKVCTHHTTRGGGACSVPPFRLKRWAVPAFLIIATVRGFLLNFGVYYAARAAIGLKEFTWSPAIACASPHPRQPPRSPRRSADSASVSRAAPQC